MATELLAYLSPDQLTVLSEETRPAGTFASLSAAKKVCIRQLVPDALPALTSAQTVDKGSYIIGNPVVRITWIIRNKTQAELDADKVVADTPIIKAALAIFDGGTATNAQIQRAIAWLIRQARG